MGVNTCLDGAVCDGAGQTSKSSHSAFIRLTCMAVNARLDSAVCDKAGQLFVQLPG